MDDETYVKYDSSTLPGPQYYNAVVGESVPEEEELLKWMNSGRKSWFGRQSVPVASKVFLILQQALLAVKYTEKNASKNG